MQRCRCGKRIIVEGEALCRLCQGIASFVAIMRIEYEIEITNDLVETTLLNERKGLYSVIAKSTKGITVHGALIVAEKPHTPKWHTFIFVRSIETPTNNFIPANRLYTYWLLVD